MNFPTNNPTRAITASPMRHELDLATIQAIPLPTLAHLHEALSAMIVIADGLLNSFGAAGRIDDAEGDLIDGVREHLADFREAIVVSMEERRPATEFEAYQRLRFLLLANIGAGATVAEIGELLDHGGNFAKPGLS